MAIYYLAGVAPLLAMLFPEKATAGSSACTGNPLQQADCEAKLAEYRGFFVWVGTGVSMHNLPQRYIDVLQPFYPGLNLGSVRFGRSGRVPPGARGITDCDRIYFPSGDYVDKLRAGNLAHPADPHQLLYHELTHAQQCAQGGGRDQYAVRWWNDLGTSLQTGPPWDAKAIHDRQPMESQASSHAGEVEGQLRDGILRTVVIRGLTSSPGSPQLVNTGVSWSANATGDETRTLQFEFALRVPYDTDFVRQQDFGSANTFTWTPAARGTHQIRVRARHSGGSLLASKTAEFSATPPAPSITSLQADPASPQNQGRQIAWTVIASASFGPLEYEFSVAGGTSGVGQGLLNWSVVRPYQAASSFAWTPTCGSYLVRVQARVAAGPGSSFPSGPSADRISDTYVVNPAAGAGIAAAARCGDVRQQNQGGPQQYRIKKPPELIAPPSDRIRPPTQPATQPAR